MSALPLESLESLESRTAHPRARSGNGNGRAQPAVRLVADLEALQVEAVQVDVADLHLADLEVADLDLADLEVADFGTADLEAVDLETADIDAARDDRADHRIAQVNIADRDQEVPGSADHSPGPGSAAVRRRPGSGDRRERVRHLLERISLCRDEVELKSLRDEVVLECRGVACAVAARYRGRGVDRNDLEQLASLGLIKAVQRWEPGRSEDFLQFAVPTIAGEIKRYFRDHSAAVRPPRRIQELRAALSSNEEGRPVRHHDDGSPVDTRSEDARQAQELGVPEAAVREAREAVRLCRPISLDAQSIWGSAVADTWGSEDERIAQVEDRMTVEVLMRSLNQREREIVRMRFVEGLSQSRIGEYIGVSQMQVSRLLRMITSKLHTELAC